jgi:hypothetical protein
VSKGKERKEPYSVKSQKKYVLGVGEYKLKWVYCRYLWEGEMVLGDGIVCEM